ncbi:hypothetical protein Xen7305DRAFT_00046750 [Xenococcus sp. PCC 7305]|uniref:hypothetical protein n=1 Tax=Xenococcus sp. PCC 7305 TaxID=102125 RepID=UPI0002ABBDB8|nr:hypothetical protein [Xenococcus sp. PCC 7305]ELS04939.1 hypothetical protein Xen7305DRAFT_00046750 [Xenococcus sp. PCC 7305]
MKIRVLISQLFLLLFMGTYLLAKPAYAFWGGFAAEFFWGGVKFFIENSNNPDRNPPSDGRKAVPWKVCVEIPGDDRLYVHPTADWRSRDIGVLTDGEEVLQINEQFAKNGAKWAEVVYKRQGVTKSGWVNKKYLAHPEDDFANCWL